MKYAIILFALLLAGCASAPKPTPKPEARLYTCKLYSIHGVYATITTVRATKAEAEQDSAQVRDRLVKMELIPECDVSCE